MELNDFEKKTGNNFRVKLGDNFIDLKLTEVKKLKPPFDEDDNGPKPDNYRAVPFALTFCGPGDTVLPTQIYEFEYDNGKSMQIVISAFFQNSEGIFYESIFN